MELAHLVVEVVLFVLERLRAADILEHELGEGCSDDVTVLGSEHDGRLTPVIDGNDGAYVGRVGAERHLGGRA